MEASKNHAGPTQSYYGKYNSIAARSAKDGQMQSFIELEGGAVGRVSELDLGRGLPTMSTYSNCIAQAEIWVCTCNARKRCIAIVGTTFDSHMAMKVKAE
jgi:hypothetical protein